ncbi:MAG: glycosyltransferase [Salinivirgaceae bacterium]|nr:glycosyltransferase [Salinivirgaceae bacterium]
MANKKVLIITYYWPPSGGAGVQRWLKFAKYLPEFGWNPVIFTPENPETPSIDESLIKDIPESVIVVKTPIWEPYTFYKKFTGKKKEDKISAGFIEEKKSKPLLEKISVFIRGNFFIPDPRKFWVSPSVKFLSNYIQKNDIETIITTGPPHSMHLIGLKLKEKMNINWIADFRDPWTNIDFYKELRLTKRSDKKHKKLENKVLTNADCVLSIGKTLGEELKNLGAKKIKVITNGYDTDDLQLSKQNLDEKFTLLHAGSLNKDRNHRILWNVLKDLAKENTDFKNKLEIKLIGKVDIQVSDLIRENGLEDCLNKIEYLPHNLISGELQNARILYLPINNTPNAKGILTGKFFEYLAAKRPILTIGLEKSDIAEILNETKAGEIFDFKNYAGIKNFVQNEFTKYSNNQEEPVSTNIDKYSRKQLTKELSELIHNINNG